MPQAGVIRMPRMVRRVAAIAIVACLAPRSDAQVGGGRGDLVAPRKTRDELVREWDLNSDGSIDQGEAEVAASRMRRERAEMRLNSGIDPVTGLPRGEPAPDVEPLEPGAHAGKTTSDERTAAEADAKRRESKPLPGTRVPHPKVAAPRLPGTRLPATEHAATPESAETKPTGIPSKIAGSRADADRRRQPLTGGVRAGGLAARAGYGPGAPAPSLNAGLPIPPKTQPTTRPAAQPRGGLVPGPRATTPTPAAPPSRSRDLYDPY